MSLKILDEKKIDIPVSTRISYDRKERGELILPHNIYTQTMEGQKNGSNGLEQAQAR